MTVELAGFVGLLAGMLVFSALLRWAIALVKTYKDYRIAAGYPHLQRARRPWIFLFMFVLHSGPWVLALTVFGAFELLTSPYQVWHSWFIGGFLSYCVLMGCLFMWARKKHKPRKTIKREGN